MAKKPKDIICMFCDASPCECFAAPKKTASKRESKSVVTKPAAVLEAPLPEPPPEPPKRVGLQALPKKAIPVVVVPEKPKRTLPPARSDEDNLGLREALTCLVKSGFQLAPIHDGGREGTFDEIKPLLNMTPVEIKIAEWKFKRDKGQ